MKTQKVKLFKISLDNWLYYEEDYENGRLLSAGVDWWEIEKEEADELQEAVNNANQSSERAYHYLLVHYVKEDDINDLYDSAKAFIEEKRKAQEELRKELKRKEEKAEKAKAARKAASLARKKKQLEKLQKELGIKE